MATSFIVNIRFLFRYYLQNNNIICLVISKNDNLDVYYYLCSLAEEHVYISPIREAALSAGLASHFQLHAYVVRKDDPAPPHARCCGASSCTSLWGFYTYALLYALRTVNRQIRDPWPFPTCSPVAAVAMVSTHNFTYRTPPRVWEPLRGACAYATRK